MSEANMISDPEATTEGYMSGIIDKNDSQLTTGQITTLQFYDSKGYSYTMKFSITSTDAEGEYTMVASDIVDSSGTSILKNTDGTAMSAEDKKTKLAGYSLFDGAASYTMKYSTTDGAWAGTADGFTLNLTSLATDYDAALTKDVNVDLSSTKNIDNDGTSTINGNTGTLANKAIGAGRAAGEMDSIAIQQDGKIIATYTNSVTKVLGQIAVASFANASGLQKEGDNLYSATKNSGEFDGVGQDVTADGGSMASGVLEMSNVDLSSEFTEMITTQRGFQANSRIITVSDTMLEELVNLKR